MARITCIGNQKGGVGKTSTAHALTTGLARKGKRVLAVDIDPQANLTYALGGNDQTAGVNEILHAQVDIKETIQHLSQCDLIPSSLRLVSAELDFQEMGREYLLKESLNAISGEYDYIVLDAPPSLGLLTINALTASSDVVITLGADIFSVQGLSQFYKTITKTKKYTNPSLKIAGLLITRYSDRAIMSKDLKDLIDEQAAKLETKMYHTVIREGIAVKEAQTQKSSIFTIAMRSNPAQDYLNFIEEYLERIDEDA